MNRRRLLASLLATSAVGCQHSPPASQTAAPAHLPMTPATRDRLAKAGIRHCARVAAYAINKGTPSPSFKQSLFIDGELNPDRRPMDGATLGDLQIQTLLVATTLKNHPGAHARCFNPRHGVAFYDGDGKTIGHLTLCFSCRTYLATSLRVVREPDYRALVGLFKQLQLLPA